MSIDGFTPYLRCGEKEEKRGGVMMIEEVREKGEKEERVHVHHISKEEANVAVRKADGYSGRNRDCHRLLILKALLGRKRRRRGVIRK